MTELERNIKKLIELRESGISNEYRPVVVYAISLLIRLKEVKGIVPEEKGASITRSNSNAWSRIIGYNACRSEVAQRVVAFGERLEKIVEEPIRNKIKFIGDNEHAYLGYPIDLITDTVHAIRKELEGKRG